MYSGIYAMFETLGFHKVVQQHLASMTLVECASAITSEQVDIMAIVLPK